MTAPLYCEILQKTLAFVQDRFPPPPTHRFMQDNDPNHTSRIAKEFFANNSINWWHTPSESPDMNPIENMWHELKEYVRREEKPRNKEQLVKVWTTIY